MDIGTSIILGTAIILSLGVMISAFIFKQIALGIISGVLWMVNAFYWFLVPSAMGFGNLYFGAIFMLLAIMMYLSPILFFKQAVGQVEEESYSRKMSKRIENMRSSTDSFHGRINSRY